MQLVTKLGLALALLIALVAGPGATYQWLEASADRARFPAPGRLVEIGGMQMHIDCRGVGQPVVILEAGLTSGSLSWALVHEAISRHTQVCAYDRPGMDWSPPVSDVGGTPDVVARLLRCSKPPLFRDRTC